MFLDLIKSKELKYSSGALLVSIGLFMLYIKMIDEIHVMNYAGIIIMASLTLTIVILSMFIIFFILKTLLKVDINIHVLIILSMMAGLITFMIIVNNWMLPAC